MSSLSRLPLGLSGCIFSCRAWSLPILIGRPFVFGYSAIPPQGAPSFYTCFVALRIYEGGFLACVAFDKEQHGQIALLQHAGLNCQCCVNTCRC